MKEVYLKWVRQKTVFLVAITSALRVSELGALSCRSDLCVFYRDKVVMRTDLIFQPKIASKFHMDLEIALPSFCPRPQGPQEQKWRTLEVGRALKFYLARTESIQNTDSLFKNISPSRMGNKISPSAISAVLWSCINEAYVALNLSPPLGITAHSTEVQQRLPRSQTGLPQRSAGASFGRRVLQQVVGVNGES